MAKLNDKNRANSNVNKNTATVCNKNQNILYNASALISNSHDFFYIIVSFQELKTPGLAITHLLITLATVTVVPGAPCRLRVPVICKLITSRHSGTPFTYIICIDIPGLRLQERP